MFVKKLIDKVSKKGNLKSGGGRKGLGVEDVNPRVVFHYGVPSGANSLAYDSLRCVLALSTIDGRIKLFGDDNTQDLLESDEAVPSKFMQFLENQGLLLNVTTENHIQVWDIHERKLSHVHVLQREITSFTVLQDSLYMYLGDRLGNITVLKLEPETCHLTWMQYNIPFSESYCSKTGAESDAAVIFMLPQPKAETQNLLIIFEDGTISLWGLQESKSLFTTGAAAMRVEPRRVTSACWVDSSGTKVAVGYSNGELFLWGVPRATELKSNMSFGQKDTSSAPNVPLLKLNLGFKMDKIPIVSLRWIPMSRKASRLYVNGYIELEDFYSLQVIILDENTESRVTKLTLPLAEPCHDLKIISCSSGENKSRHDALVLLMKSGHLCIYKDSEIEDFLLHCQSKSSMHLPQHVNVKTMFSASTVTVATFISQYSDLTFSNDDEDMSLVSKLPRIISFDASKDNFHLSSSRMSGSTKTSNLYITGHQDGSINFWDASCPIILPMFTINHQRQNGHSLSDSPVKALHFDISSQLLVSGHQSGQVQIFLFQITKPIKDNIFFFLQAKQGSNYTVHTLKLNGGILSIRMNSESRRLAVGTDKGFVAVIELEGRTIVYQKHFPGDVHQGIVSLLFAKVDLSGCEKNVLLASSEDSSVTSLEEGTGVLLSTSPIQPKKPSRTLFLQIIDSMDTAQEPLLLLCSDDSVRLFFLLPAIQGIKKVYHKKRLQGNCCWASTFCSPYGDLGLVLIFSNGKIEIRSLPELNLLKGTSVRGLPTSSRGTSSKFDGVICSSPDGEVIMVKGDQEMFFYSVLVRSDVYRLLGSISFVYKSSAIASQASSPPVSAKEKKKGLFGSVLKDMKGSKGKQELETEDVVPVASVAELFSLFSSCNFSMEVEKRNDRIIDNGDAELDIDDIDLDDDPKEGPKGQNIAMLNKHLGKKFIAFKGKLINKTTKTSDLSASELKSDKPTGTIDDIKKRYGYSSSATDTDVPTLARDKLHDNVKKLEGISLRTTEMQNTASSFSSLAKQLLHGVEKDNKGEK